MQQVVSAAHQMQARNAWNGSSDFQWQSSLQRSRNFFEFSACLLRGYLMKQSTCKQMLLLGFKQLLCMRRHSLSLMDGGLRLWYSEDASGAVRNKMFCQVGFYASSIPKCLNQKSLPIRAYLILSCLKRAKGWISHSAGAVNHSSVCFAAGAGDPGL